MTKQEIIELGKSLPLGKTYDKNGNLLSYKGNNENWGIWTYNENGKISTYKDSYGLLRKYTYDENGNLLTLWENDGTHVKFTKQEIIELGKELNNDN